MFVCVFAFRAKSQRTAKTLRRIEARWPEGLLRYDTLLNSISTAKNALLTV